jgi:hypothetical protein
MEGNVEGRGEAAYGLLFLGAATACQRVATAVGEAGTGGVASGAGECPPSQLVGS